ncbi:MAG: hypothetical protein PWQ73_149 [Petrotoga sp.]|jgi:hypothetical protein|nr:hypothetical protein [Petrotoga sp.]
MIEFLLEISFDKRIVELNKLFIKEPKQELHFQEPSFEFISWGDPIMNDGFREKLSANPEPDFILNNLSGHFYFILLKKTIDEIIIGNSMFSILPLYYYKNHDKITFSDNAIQLAAHLKLNTISMRFILETILFNYPLFNHSIIEGINLLPSNSYVKISGTNLNIIKHTKIETYFSSSPIERRKAVNKIRDLFLEETVKKYLPANHYCHALTGGFDGRTLVSSALYHKKDFSCYSFGTSESKDTLIASRLSEIACRPFINIELNDNYTAESSLVNGIEFIQNSSGSATFARAHYLHAAKKLAGEFEYIVTGNFGSEIFRAAHVAGVVISKCLYDLFKAKNADEGIKAVENSSAFNYLNTGNFYDAWEELKSDLFNLPCYDTEYSSLTQNQKFYVFVFEELFRKYFGAEMVNQFRYLKNRSPFLDFDFLKELFKTELAGIHSDFFEHNPLKRYKGQVLYAYIINKAYPPFGRIITDKGYRPDDLLNLSGKLNITIGYLRKIVGRKSLYDSDPYAVNKAWGNNKDFWLGLPVSKELFNLDKNSLTINKDILFKILSFSYLLSQK